MRGLGFTNLGIVEFYRPLKEAFMILINIYPDPPGRYLHSYI